MSALKIQKNKEKIVKLLNENIDLEKYVDLKKSCIIECIYNKKFKKWIPRSLAKNNNMIDKNKINLIINKNKFFL